MASRARGGSMLLGVDSSEAAGACAVSATRGQETVNRGSVRAVRTVSEDAAVHDLLTHGDHPLPGSSRLREQQRDRSRAARDRDPRAARGALPDLGVDPAHATPAGGRVVGWTGGSGARGTVGPGAVDRPPGVTVPSLCVAVQAVRAAAPADLAVARRGRVERAAATEGLAPSYVHGGRAYPRRCGRPPTFGQCALSRR